MREDKQIKEQEIYTLEHGQENEYKWGRIIIKQVSKIRSHS